MDKITNGMSEEEQIAYIQEVLRTVAIDDQARLKRGLQLRDEMHAAIARGEEPRGYRVDWLERSVQRVIQVVLGCGEEFNTLYNDDKASQADFADILLTAMQRLGVMEASEEETEETDEEVLFPINGEE